MNKKKNNLFKVFKPLFVLIGLFWPLALYAAVPSTPSTPWDGGLRYHPVNSTFTISWNKHSNATYYLLNGANVGNVTSKTHSYSTYGWRGFRVQACNSQGCSGQSNSRNVYVYTAPGPVKNLAASASSTKVGNSVNLSWGGPGGAVPGVTYNVVINGSRITTSATSYTATVNREGSNTFAVNACNPKGVGCGSSRYTYVTGTIDPPGRASPITMSSLYHPVNTNVTISWPSVSNASSYVLYENGSSVYSGSGRSTTRKHSAYGRRLYTVQACNSGGCGSQSSAMPVVYYTAPGPVQNLAATPATLDVGGSATLTWDTAGGAVPGVFYKVNVNGTIKTTSARSYSVPVNKVGSNSYTVNACNPNNVGCGSSRSVSVTGTMDPPGRASPITMSSLYHPVNTNVTISWPAVSNASSYVLYEDGTSVYSGSGRSTTRNHSAYGRRLYTVKACNAGGCGSQSSAMLVVYYTAPGPVQNLAATPATLDVGGSATLTWDTAGGAVPGVFYKVNVNGTIKTTSARSYSVPVNKVGSNNYTVNACNPNNVGCGSSRSVSVTGTMDPPGTASPITMSSLYHPVNTNVTISWPAVSNASSYVLYEDGTSVYSGSGRSTTRNHSAYGRRLYTVQACNAGGCGSQSSAMPVVYYTAPGPVRDLAATPASVELGGSATLSWGIPGGAVPGAYYKVRVNGTVITTTDLSQVVTADSYGSNTFMVNACNPNNVGCGSSVSVSVEVALPKLAAPQLSSVYQPVNTAVDVQWPSVPAGLSRKLFYTAGLPIDATAEQIYANRVEITSTPAPSHAQYGYVRYFAQACESSGSSCGDFGAYKRVVLYTAPGPVRDIAATPASVELGGSATLSWGIPGGAVPGAYYKVRVNDQVITTTDLSQVVTADSYGSNTFMVNACNPNNVGCGSSVSVSVEVALPKLAAPQLSSVYQPVNTAVDVQWPSVPAGLSRKLFYTAGLPIDATAEQIYANRVEITSTPAPSHAQYGYVRYFAQACESSGSSCGDFGAYKRVVLYTAPGPVKNLTAPATVTVDEPFVIDWDLAGGIVPGGYYRIVQGGQLLYSDEPTQFNTSLSEPGEYTFHINACNPNNVGCGGGQQITVTVEQGSTNTVPAVASFSADKTTINSGETVKLQWQMPADYSTEVTYNLAVEKPDGSPRYTFSNDQAELFFDRTINMAGVHTFFVWACESADKCGPTRDLTVTVNEGGSNGAVETPPSIHVEAIPTSANDKSTVAGTLSTEFSVDESGAATLSLPIALPQGIGGISPQVSVNYHSLAGNGLMGLGWSLNAAGAITRCRQTFETDGISTAISHSASDKFCLNGQRLVAVANEQGVVGSYGANNTEYRTVLDSQIRVVSKGTAGSGPAYFTVERADGSFSEYGNSTDSVMLDGTTVVRWHVNSQKDHVNNEIVYNYTSDGVGIGQNELLLDSIVYSGNTVDLQYNINALRTDIQSSYSAGMRFEQLARLDAVVISNHNNVTINSYHFGYSNQPTGETVLDDITQCDGALTGLCLPATRFDWTDFESGYSSARYTTIDQSNVAVNRQLDFDADGQMDMVYLSFESNNATQEMDIVPFTIHTLKGSGNSFTNTGVPADYSYNSALYNSYAMNKSVSVADVDGDGRQDLLFYQYRSSNDRYWSVLLSKVNAQGNNYWLYQQLDSTFDLYNMVVADLDGDGRVELLYKLARNWNNGNYELSYYTTVNTLFDTAQVVVVEPKSRALLPAYSARYFGDFNGDGLTDFIAAISDVTLTYAVFVSRQNEDGTITMVELADSEFTSGISEILVSDLNGDGLSDLVFNGAMMTDLSEVKWRYRLSTGSGMTAAADVGLVSGYSETSDYNNFQMGDINVDGLLDLVYYQDSVDNWYYRPFNGNGFDNAVVMTIPAGVRGEFERESAFFTDYNGNGYSDLLYFDGAAKRIVKYPDENTEPKAKIEQINNGRGLVTDIVYKPLTDSSVYSRGSGANQLNWGNGAAVMDLISPTQVVSSVSSSAPGYDADGTYQADATARVDYFYSTMRIQAGGRGNLGFASIQTTDAQSGVVTLSEYRQDFPYSGLPTRTVQTLGDQTLSEATNTYVATPMMLNGGKVYFPYLDASSETTYVINSETGLAEAISTTVTDNTYTAFADNHAQLSQVSVTVTDHTNDNATAETTTVNQYSEENESVANWWLNRVEKTTVTHSRSDSYPAADIVRTSTFGYDETTGVLNLTEVEANPDGSDVNLYLGTLKCFDSFGNQTKIIHFSNHYSPTCTSTAPNTSDDPLKVYRVKQDNYDAQGRFVTSSGNQTFTATTTNARDDWGKLIQATDINGVVSDIRYDAFGSEYFRRDSLGSFVKNERRFVEDAAEIGAPTIDETYDLVQRAIMAGKPTRYKYYDKTGRLVAEVIQGFAANSWIYQYSRYNSNGEVVAKSNPSHSKSPAYWSYSEIDALGRIVSTTAADGVTTTRYDYAKTTVTSTVSSSLNGYSVNQSQTERKNVHGDVLEVTDNNSKTIIYEYNASGIVTRVTGVDDQQIVNVVDKLGRRTSSTDPNMGLWHYSYNALGEVASKTDAKQQVTTRWRDNLGRVVKRTVAGEQTDYNYGSSHLLQSQNIVGGSAIAFGYDDFGRGNLTTTTLDGTAYYNQTTFDQYGRVFQQFDASTSSEKGLGIRYHFNSQGYLYKEQEAREGTDGTVYLEVLAMDALGNVTSSRQGGNRTTTRVFDGATGLIDSIVAGNQAAIQNWSHTFDGLGNLRVRNNHNGASERFVYDNLNRLKEVYRTIDGIEVKTKDMTYADNGNILAMSAGSLGGSESYGYNESQCNNVAGPHAVSSRGSLVYCYDANGNQTYSKDANTQAVKRSVSYSAFNKPVRIESNGKLTTFDYDSEHNRYKRVDAEADGSDATTTYYIGNVQLIRKADGSTNLKRYLGSYAIADSYGSAEQQLSYLHQGHLGSLDVVTNAAGLIVERASFDAFGQRRAPDDLSVLVAANSVLSLQGLLELTNRGYTGQEHVDSAGLIHMNGRIYDPLLGRFIQGDPVVQAPKNTQNFNRYSYVINNPLAGTDPSGNTFILSKAIRWVFSKLSYSGGQIVASIASMYCGPAVALCAAALSYENARAHGYSRGTAMQAGVYAGISAGVFQMIGTAYSNTNLGCPSCYNEAGQMVSGMGSKALSHAVAGGVMSSLQGGKFGHGFMSAGATELMAPQIGRIYKGKGGIYRGVRVMAAAVVGGTVSQMTGGKFANGAVTAAFSRAFNAESHDEVDFTDELIDREYSKEPMLEADVGITVKNRAGVVTTYGIFSQQTTQSVNLVEIPTSGVKTPLVGQDVIVGLTFDSKGVAVYDLQLQQSFTLADLTLSHASVVDTDMKFTEQIHIEYKNVGVQPKASVSAKPIVFNWGVLKERVSHWYMRCRSRGMCYL